MTNEEIDELMDTFIDNTMRGVRIVAIVAVLAVIVPLGILCTSKERDWTL